MTTFYAAQGDAKVEIDAVLADADGDTPDLTGATVHFKAGRKGAATVIDGIAVPDPDQVAHRGRVTYTFAADDLDDIHGPYQAVFVATWPGGTTLTFPTVPFTLNVVQQVGT